ncbi:MAG: SpoIIE family protein phosphatase [Blastocatellia bacterium]|nr:SpoIIE family protein phosphatase [Blastocatellia bacterium]
MKNRHTYYIPLAVLFLIAAAYQVRFSQGRIQYLSGSLEGISVPVNTGRASQAITFVGPEAKEAGIHEGDQLLAIEGHPFTGKRVLYDHLYDARPGDTLTLSVRHKEDESRSGEEEKITVRLVSTTLVPQGVGDWLFVIVLSLAMPVFCLLLGFGVAALRPRDPIAWLLLGLMLSFGQFILGVDMLAWRGWLRDLMVAYQTFFQSAWPLWMLLFGIYFPERWSVDRRGSWMKWVFIAPNVAFILKDTIIAVGDLRNFAAVAPIHRLFQPLGIAELVISMVSIGFFFAALGHKTGTASTPDARRRLRLLQIGTTVGATPAFLVFLYSLARGLPPNQALPAWIALGSLLLLFLFPLTFAYVIVVHRALDVRVVIRQGVQYAFARRGILVLRFVIIVATILAMISQVDRPDARCLDIVITIGIGVALIFLVRRLGEWLIRWTDRRFFREAYNAEHILSDLSEKVRTMVETGPLLETVAETLSRSLHVPRVALLLGNDGTYSPAHALGYEGMPEISFNGQAATVEHLKREKEPVRIYFDDEDSWVYKTPGMDDERGMLEKLDSQLLLPLAVKESLSGFISLGPKQSEEPYSGTDLRLLQSVATQTALALENSQLTARIASEVAQRERLNRELEIAREVQERLFPQKLPPVSGIDYCGACRPALGVGGDYYDFLLLPGDIFGIAIGDVSGKGIAAALLMASLQASLRSQAIQGTGDLAELMGNVNRLVYDASAENRYATFFYAQYETASRRLAYVNAGHNPPVILRKAEGDWQVLRLEDGGPVVGLLRNFPYTQTTVTLEPGDTLVAFTDGISEAMNPDEEEWGEDRFIEAAKACQGLGAADTISRLVAGADLFANGAKQHDDMTLLIVQVA